MNADSEDVLRTVKVPDSLSAPFIKAQDYVGRYFQKKMEDPRRGIIEVGDERYILVRAASLSKEFFDLVTSLYHDRGEEQARTVAFGFLFDMAHSIGKADAKSFFSKMDVSDPVEKLSAGPIHFAYTGWAFVEIFPESNPTPDEDYYLIYDHPYSFEASEWIKSRERTDFPVCAMNAGYSSGWCEESFGVHLVAAEIQCRAKGDEHCRFIMAPPSRIKEHIARYGERFRDKPVNFGATDIPEFFQRKRLEDELLKSEETVRALLNAPNDRALLLDKAGNILALNETAASALKISPEKLVGRNAFDLFPHPVSGTRRAYHEKVVRSGKSIRYEDLRDGRCMDTTVDPVRDAQGNVARVAVVSRDMTEHKRMEEELRGHRDHLEDLIKERTDTLLMTNERLQKEIAERNEAEKALKKSENMLRAIFDQTFQFVALLGLDGTVLNVNKTAMSFVGTTKEDVFKKPFWDTPWWDHSRVEQTRLRDAIRQAAVGRLVRFETTHFGADGKRLNIDFSLKPVKGEDGKIALLIAEGRDITELKSAVENIKKREIQLETQSKNLEEANIAMKVLLERVEDKRGEDKEDILTNVKQLVMPYMDRLRKSYLSRDQHVLLNTLESNLKSITSPLVSKLSSSFLNLTPMEIRIAQLVKEGLMNKEIADLLGVSLNTVSSHRYKIRSKLGLKNKGANLRSYLLSLEE